jgi:serine protease
VSESDQSVTVKTHVTDDTGARSVSLWVNLNNSGAKYYADWAKLVEGTPRDGWWESTVTIPRYARPGTYSYRVSMQDRMGRSVYGYVVPDEALEVTTSVADTERPVVLRLSEPSPETVVDVRETADELVVTAHLTDNLSGVGFVTACARPATYYIPGSRCGVLSLVSGTELDGIWSVTIPLAQGEITDQWKLSMLVEDRANAWDHADYTSSLESWGIHFSPEGSGVFQVLGSDPPEPGQPPGITSIEITPSEVDTLPSAATVSTVVAIDDPDDLVLSASVVLQQRRQDGSGYTDVEYGSYLQQGADGMWRADVVLPQGAPPGQYEARVNASTRQYSYLRYMQSYVTVVDSRTP